MTIGKEIEQLRTGELVLHCVQIEVFQIIEDGLKMSGHGTINVNNVGTIYMEFICTTSKNVPHELFSERLPKDPLNEQHKLYLRAQTLSGDVYLSDGFSLQINMNSSHPPVHHYIFLSSINCCSTAEPHQSKEGNYLYFEFAEHFNIPANKSNSVISSLGYESYSRNQTVLEMDGYSISMVKELGYTEVRVKGCFDPEELLQCLKFYIGFSSASMPQFVYILKCKGEDKQEIISSIVNNQKRQRSSSPMVENVADRKYRDAVYHYKLLDNIISLRKKNPRQFESIYSQWERVWFSFQSKNSIMILTLSVAIEGLLNDIYIPAIKAKQNNLELEVEIKKVKQQIRALELTDDQRSRIMGSVSYWKNITAAKALEYLIEQGVITRADKKLWQELRNESAHPKVREDNLAKERLEREKVSSCLNLFHKIVLNTLAFSGPICILQAGKEPVCEELIHTEILN
ncbi:hypothetical protein [uncultured Pseudoalteromonas sp.]|uniref:hypothetical protein n=1 Tax=uncultured Pseudoalteromonas sp. TaxID=114053 RepID=UPI000C3B839D|nr:hypothetical protein [Pseudoalteromonas sp.]|tara:strand:+ start:5529 stop:6902 length:1374 start_codon:yes stop_codon:yes gene_type:complete